MKLFKNRLSPLRSISISLATCVSLFGQVSPAFAEMCGVSQPSDLNRVGELLVGDWTAKFGPGYVVAGAMVLPHPAAPSEDSGKIWLRDGRLTLSPNTADGVEISFDWETSVDWSFDAQPTVPELDGVTVPDIAGVSDEDMSLVVGCDMNDLPRLVGAESIPIDGGQMTFVLRLIVINEGLIMGFQQMHGVVDGMSVVERRRFSLER